MRHTLYLATALTVVAFTACSEKAQKDLKPRTDAVLSADAAAAVTVTYTDESSFVTSLSSFGFKTIDKLSLNRVATATGYNTVYGFNIPAANQVKGFKWNDGDEQTNEWRPQGITGLQYNGKNYLLITWYGVGPDDVAGVKNQEKGVRISLVDITDMTNITYRHILLVQNSANISNTSLFNKTNAYNQLGLFAPVTIHAGGVAYYAGKIYVADTKLGIRVFDLSKMVSAAGDPNEVNCGKDTDGTLKAFNYGYILPQTGYYKISGGNPYSFIETGTGTSASQIMLWTGQYITKTDGGTPKLFGFTLNTSGKITTDAVQSITPKDNDSAVAFDMQGAYRAGNESIMVLTGKSSYEGSTARLLTYTDGTVAGARYRWPHGGEDLYYEAGTGLLWNLTEYETEKYGQDNRCVFCVRLADYK